MFWKRNGWFSCEYNIYFVIILRLYLDRATFNDHVSGDITLAVSVHVPIYAVEKRSNTNITSGTFKKCKPKLLYLLLRLFIFLFILACTCKQKINNICILFRIERPYSFWCNSNYWKSQKTCDDNAFWNLNCDIIVLVRSVPLRLDRYHRTPLLNIIHHSLWQSLAYSALVNVCS